MEDTGSTATKEKKGCCKIDNVWLFEKIAGDFDETIQKLVLWNRNNAFGQG